MAEWVLGGCRFTEAEDGMTIRSRAEQGRWYWLSGLVVFVLVLLTGGRYLIDLARELHAGGLMTGAGSGWTERLKAVGGVMAFVGVVLGVMLAWARPVFGGHEVLRLRAGGMTLESVDFGVRWRTRAFEPGEVRRVQYKVVASSDTGDEYAIEFRGRRRRVRMFRNVPDEAAAEVMGAMRRYGF